MNDDQDGFWESLTRDVNRGATGAVTNMFNSGFGFTAGDAVAGGKNKISQALIDNDASRKGVVITKSGSRWLG